MPNRRLPLLVAFVAVTFASFLFSAVSVAQEHPTIQRGFAPEKTFQIGDIDNVNLLNGNLVISIPIGQRYSTWGGFSYGLTLYYNSHIWDWQDIPDPVPYTKAIPSRQGNNAGFGWTVSLGRVMAPLDGSNTSGKWVYVSPDGAQHNLYLSLHATEPTVAGTAYSRDGSYLRIHGATASSTAVTIDFPSGEVHSFLKFAADDWRLVSIKDPFNNGITVAYTTSTWTITDNFQRNQVVTFESANGFLRRLRSVALTGFGGPSSTYTFAYADATLSRGCPDSDLTPIPQKDKLYSLLKQINLPDGSTYKMPLADYFVVSGVSCSPTSGLLHRITLPTGGRIDYTYTNYKQVVPEPDCLKPIRGSFTSSTGVGTRTLVTGTGPDALWTYTPTITPWPHGPGICDPPREFVNTVQDPLGDKTVHYFSMFREGQTNTEGWQPSEFGLPFTRFQNDGHGHFLSSEVLDCDATGGNCTAQRSSYVNYEQDRIPAIDDNLGNQYDVNSRVVKSSKIERGTINDYSDETNDRFDGFGHYRSTVLGGNYQGGGNSKALTTEYNPESGIYPNGGVGSTFVQRADSDPWVLGTFTEKTTSEAGNTAKVQYCFTRNASQQAATGFLERTRALKNKSGSISANDVISAFTGDTRGNITKAEFFGGDIQTVPTSDVCTASLPPNSYAIQYTSPDPTINSWVRQQQYLLANGGSVGFLSVDETLDSSTGLVASSRDATGLTTAFEYDPMGRLSYVKPAQDGWTQYLYTLPTPTVPAAIPAVQVKRQNNGGTSDLAQSRVIFDGLGRVVQEQELRPGNIWVSRVTSYDPAGNKDSVSEMGSLNNLTHYSFYDPFGRPGSMTLPDGHGIGLTHIRFASSTRSPMVGTAWNGVSVTESSADTQQYFDRQGRLWRVREQPNGIDTFTNYGYDSSNRLISVSTTSNGFTQNRAFDYDNRGFLSSETHPEKGATGNGTVRYTYDARGHLLRSTDGPHDLTYAYDRAERLKDIRETGSPSGDCTTLVTARCVKQFSYDTAGLGKLAEQSRYNYVMVGMTPFRVRIRERMTYSGLQGRLSTRVTENYTAAGTNSFPGTPSESFTQGWTYTPLGDVATLSYPQCGQSGCTATPRTIQDTYIQGRLRTVAATVPPAVYASSITYLPSGLVWQVTHQNSPTVSTLETQNPDTNGMARPLSFTVTRGASTLWSSGSYSYDGNGNVTGIGGGYFFYDQASRLVGTYNQQFVLDAFGNRQALCAVFHVPGLPGVECGWPGLTDPATNRMPAPAAYDAAGNLISKGPLTYTYDALNQMTHLLDSAQGKEWLYLYTADDERVWSFPVAGTSPASIWTIRNLDGSVLREYAGNLTTGAWSVNADYIYRGGKLLAAETPSGVRHMYLDHLGSPQLYTDSNGQVVLSRAFWPYGDEVTTPFLADSLRLRFTGHEDEMPLDQSDTIYMHARHYSRGAGTFLSVDKHAGHPSAPQSWNRYTYALGNPIKYLDPSGNAAVGFTGFLNDANGGVGQIVQQINGKPGVGQARLFRHQDVAAAVKFLAGQHGEHPNQPILITGHSLGAASAVQAAAQLGEQGIKVQLLITIDPVFTDKTVSRNVIAAGNLFQTANPLLGGDKLVAADPSATTIVNEGVEGLGAHPHTVLDDVVANAVALLMAGSAQGTLAATDCIAAGTCAGPPPPQ